MTEVYFLSDPLRTPLAYDPCFKGMNSKHFYAVMLLKCSTVLLFVKALKLYM